jgi:hypothetical protein
MEVETMGLGLAFVVACAVALMWIVAFGQEQSPRS